MYATPVEFLRAMYDAREGCNLAGQLLRRCIANATTAAASHGDNCVV
jgi:hypothetical protein